MSLTVTRLIELAEELADTPTLSVYVSTETARRRGATHGAWRADVVALMQTLRGRLIDIVPRGDRELFDRNLRRLELRLRGLPHATRAAGWLIVVARGDVHYCAPVTHAGDSEARWQHGPWLSPAAATAAIASQDSPFLPTPATYWNPNHGGCY